MSSIGLLADDHRNQQRQPSASIRVIRETPSIPGTTISIDDEQRLLLKDLECAMRNGHGVIVVEPIFLGDNVSRWICLGNLLHKTAVVCGVVSSLGFWIGNPFPNVRGLWLGLCSTIGAVSFGAYTLHTFSWQKDPCCDYQVEMDPLVLGHMLKDCITPTAEQKSISGDQQAITSASVVVLVKKDGQYRCYLQNLVAAALTCTVLYRLYQAKF